MRARWSVPAMFVVLGALYICYNYVTYYRIDPVVRQYDTMALPTTIDLYCVCDDPDDERCGTALGAPAKTPTATYELPAFGTSYLRDTAGNPGNIRHYFHGQF